MAKNSEALRKWIRIILIIGAIIASIAGGYAALGQKVKNHGVRLNKHDTKIESHEKAVIEMRTDIKYIRKGMEKQEDILEDIRDKLE